MKLRDLKKAIELYERLNYLKKIYAILQMTDSTIEVKHSSRPTLVITSDELTQDLAQSVKNQIKNIEYEISKF